MYFKIAIGAALVLLAQSALAEHICGDGKTKESVPYRYCLDSENPIEQALQENANVVYFLHGMGASENEWSTGKSYRELRSRWHQKGNTQPIVLSISFGPLWLLTDTPKIGPRSLRSLFTEDIMSALEARFAIRDPKRVLLGESMGGFNAVQLLAKNGGKFKRVALVCPALATVGPLSSEDEILSYIDRHRPYVQPDWVRNTIALTRSEFPTETDWLKHDPFMIVLKLTHASPKLFVSCTTQDEHGFYEGAVRFAREADEQGVATKWLPIIGGSHCRQTEASLKALAEFLAGD